MIEVEKKFILDDNDLSRLLDGAEFLGENVIEDTYYDHKDFSMMKRGEYLRKRGTGYELKLSLRKRGADENLDRYREIENDKEIRDFLGIGAGDMEEELKAIGITPFAKYVTTRKKYKKEGFGIDVDSTDFGFNITEIELMVSGEGEIDTAKNKIYAFAEAINLKIAYEEGKLLEYMKVNNPQAYSEIKEVWRKYHSYK